jgi:hypothetical protein
MASVEIGVKYVAHLARLAFTLNHIRTHHPACQTQSLRVGITRTPQDPARPEPSSNAGLIGMKSQAVIVTGKFTLWILASAGRGKASSQSRLSAK